MILLVDKKTTTVFFVAIITIAFFSYYFGFYLPDKKSRIADEQQKQGQLVKEQQKNNQVNPEIDIENTVVLCKNEEKFIGKKLISDGVNFQVIDGSIFYKGEELERLCNPALKEFDYEAEPSFHIFPAYKGEN